MLLSDAPEADCYPEATVNTCISLFVIRLPANVW